MFHNSGLGLLLCRKCRIKKGINLASSFPKLVESGRIMISLDSIIDRNVFKGQMYSQVIFEYDQGRIESFLCFTS